jgi:hypothetical protein
MGIRSIRSEVSRYYETSRYSKTIQKENKKMKVEFMEDEMLILAMYRADSREASLDLMEEALFALEQDPDMAALLSTTINKLTQITDDEYLDIGFSEYEEQLNDISSERDEDNEPAVNMNAADRDV